jgi:hypothetical protein
MMTPTIHGSSATLDDGVGLAVAFVVGNGVGKIKVVVVVFSISVISVVALLVLGRVANVVCDCDCDINDDGSVTVVLLGDDKVVGRTVVPHLASSRGGHDTVVGKQDNGGDSAPQAVPTATRGTRKFASPLQHCDPVGDPPVDARHVQATHAGQRHITGKLSARTQPPAGLEFGQQTSADRACVHVVTLEHAKHCEIKTAKSKPAPVNISGV